MLARPEPVLARLEQALREPVLPAREPKHQEPEQLAPGLLALPVRMRPADRLARARWNPEQT